MKEDEDSCIFLKKQALNKAIWLLKRLEELQSQFDNNDDFICDLQNKLSLSKRNYKSNIVNNFQISYNSEYKDLIKKNQLNLTLSFNIIKLIANNKKFFN